MNTASGTKTVVCHGVTGKIVVANRSLKRVATATGKIAVLNISHGVALVYARILTHFFAQTPMTDTGLSRQ